MTRISQKLKNLWPFTIKFYAISFIILMSLIFGLLGWGMQYKLDTIRNEALESNNQAAAAEIGYVISHITDAVRVRAQAIAGQDETHQQLFDPVYYYYWRDNRILGNGALPHFLPAVELYNQQGNALAERTTGDMPKLLSRQDLGNFVTRQGGHDFLYLFYPVSAVHGNTSPIRGYIGFKLDLLEALRNEQRFNYVDIDSLEIKLKENERVPLDQILPHLEFSLVPNTENMALTASIERFQRQILFSMLVLYFLFYLMLSSVLSAPLRRLSLHIDALRKGQGGLLSQSYTRSLPVAELEKMRTSLNDYQSKLEEMHLNLSEKNDELWQLAHHDPLTGIYNRRGFEEDWKHMLSVSAGHRLGVALLLFDCDHFKAINDTYGHPTGDQVIQAITQTLQNTLRHGDRLYRIGGDEFATLFLDIDAVLALHTAERCIEAVSQYDFTLLGIKEPVRISAGMAYATGIDVEMLTSLPKQADVAMYHAKRPGKSKIAVYDPSMSDNASILFSSKINSIIFSLMEGADLIEMHYQPIANLGSGKVDYYEALLRVHDGDNLIMPSTIFPIIEERRIEAEFDVIILGQIARDIESGKIPEGTGISFNVSGPGLIDPVVLEKIKGLAIHLRRYKLIIEVTETALITQLHLASSILNQLRQQGFLIALDDFGSGYSSLSYLANMPVDCVKFDISLIRQLFEGSRQSVIIENLAAMVIKAGYTLVAEGVETEDILKKIAQMGFTSGQGFLFGRPDKACREAATVAFFDHIG
ncbi:MAG TPA: bifunctional diguanylate cyclase/phosphodiesterase [Gallionellaceae bacterium]|nr:bifunctional diguanylate cyclase/phosphodiesterase [Gallionellaceae bacterium]